MDRGIPGNFTQANAIMRGEAAKRTWLGGQGTVGAYLVGLDDEKRRLIEYHTRQAYLVGEPDGPRSIAATTWVVRGTNP
jgi:hypothetical protein